MSQSENNLYVYIRKIIITSNNSNREVKCISLLSSAFCCYEETVLPVPIQSVKWNTDFWSEIRKFFSILHICSQTNKLHLLLLVHFYLITVDYSLSTISVKVKFHKISHCQHIYDFGQTNNFYTSCTFMFMTYIRNKRTLIMTHYDKIES